MKKRMGFVSNSSSSSFLCEVCGEIESGMDLCLGDAGYCECADGHVFCEGHKLEKVKEEKEEKKVKEKKPCCCEMKKCECEDEDEDEDEDDDYDDDDEYDEYHVPIAECPVCQFKTLTDVDGFTYMQKMHNVTVPQLLSQISSTFPSYKMFSEFLRLKVDEKEVEKKGKKERLLDKMDEAIELVRSNKVKHIDVDEHVSVYKAGTVTRIDIKD